MNPSANVFVFGDFNVHHNETLTYSDGTDRLYICFTEAFCDQEIVIKPFGSVFIGFPSDSKGMLLFIVQMVIILLLIENLCDH